MNILLIGGAGYIGSNVSKLLKVKKPTDHVTVLDNFSTGRKEALVPGVEWIVADTNNYEQLLAIFKSRKFDIVMDFAALTVVSESVVKPIDYYEDNFVGSLNILKAMKATGVRKIIFSSTAAVYGNPVQIPVKEEAMKAPINPYGNSKLCTEMLLQDTQKAGFIDYVIFRYFNVAGASEDGKYGFYRKNPTLLIPALNNALLAKDDFYIFGDDYPTIDGTCVRDYIHVVDLANAHLLAMDWLFQNNTSGDFNLGSGAGFSVLQIANETKKTLKTDFVINYGARRLGDPAILITNNDKALKVLGFKLQKDLSDMIRSDYNFRAKNWEIINQTKYANR